MKKILISICLLIFTTTLFAQVSDWPRIRRKQNFLDSVYFAKLFKIGNDTVASRAYSRLFGGGGGEIIYVTSITVSGAGGSSTITIDNGTLQLSASILPIDATYQSVSWSIADGSGHAYINGSGLVTAVTDGTVTARATAIDGSGVYDEYEITISNQITPPPTGIRFIKSKNGNFAKSIRNILLKR